MKVVTISIWLNFGYPASPERGLWRSENFWLRLTTASAQCLRLSERFFSFLLLLSSTSCLCKEGHSLEFMGFRRYVNAVTTTETESVALWLHLTKVRLALSRAHNRIGRGNKAAHTTSYDVDIYTFTSSLAALRCWQRAPVWVESAQSRPCGPSRASHLSKSEFLYVSDIYKYYCHVLCKCRCLWSWNWWGSFSTLTAAAVLCSTIRALSKTTCRFISVIQTADM